MYEYAVMLFPVHHASNCFPVGRPQATKGMIVSWLGS